ncbi:hypothetical protein AA23498_1361 [Acetobacter nitrogenifigens DSM 23921 = NBRC 105050]|uniref:Uncharacterized protein n=1 Tax=Acetobacter nitrogenifigens DSM 23921 = NBRC 105050 TaxID=1120919 RepID=A0A511X5A9_9PROT|nr:hypothetical protein AA23498_1361 [Acetobacter nitrogenifigens DSM 23921 = NBRC 105050]GEN58131.1 hypothetical protein ANI02nite_00150 [Acetobacter nitrogenifigens DSM 23921 = NBRC 105050]
MAHGGRAERPDQPLCPCGGLSHGFFYRWPGDWESLPADLSQFFTGWTRSECEGLNGAQLWQAAADVRRIAEMREKAAKRNGKSGR